MKESVALSEQSTATPLPPSASAIEHITVIGAGTMGHGIAAQAARCGYSVHLYDPQEEALSRGLTQISALYEKAVARSKMTAEQAEVLIRTLSFSDDKKDALIALYPQLVDPDQVGRLYQLLDHSSDRRKARKEIDRINLQRRQAQGR